MARLKALQRRGGGAGPAVAPPADPHLTPMLAGIAAAATYPADSCNAAEMQRSASQVRAWIGFISLRGSMLSFWLVDLLCRHHTKHVRCKRNAPELQRSASQVGAAIFT